MNIFRPSQECRKIPDVTCEKKPIKVKSFI